MGTQSPTSIRPFYPPGDPPSSETSQSTIVSTQDEGIRSATISVLPDDVLLDIIDFYRNNYDPLFCLAQEWHVLVHVCQRWRQVVFASPQRLKIQILCTYGTPVSKSLDSWPAFPIVLNFHPWRRLSPKDEGNVIATLEQPNRVSSVTLYVTGLQLGKMVTVMREPFPVLTRIFIVSKEGNAPVIPAKFLGGSAPCLQEITLSGIPYPTLPTLLLSSSDLITLTLKNIPPTGYISPEAMGAGLAALPRLKNFTIRFQSDTSHPNQRRPPPVTRTVLPSLTFFQFEGASEYLEDFLSQMDSPQLKQIHIVYLDWPVDFQLPQLSTFIERSVGPEPCRDANVSFDSNKFYFTFYRHEHCPDWARHSVLATISAVTSYLQVSDLVQVLTQFSATLANVACLELDGQFEDDRLEETDDVEWLDLFRPFSALQTLLVSHEPAGFVALALVHIAGETVAEVLPFLDLIYLEDQPASFVETFDFVAVRRLSDRPITIAETEMEFYYILDCNMRK